MVEGRKGQLSKEAEPPKGAKQVRVMQIRSSCKRIVADKKGDSQVKVPA